jgi:hypothetical protein
MRYPDAVTILRAAGEDEYGNPGRAGWAEPAEAAARAFIVAGSRIANGQRVPATKAYFPPGTDIRDGDRLRAADGTVYDVATPTTARSPSRPVMITAGLTRRD